MLQTFKVTKEILRGAAEAQRDHKNLYLLPRQCKRDRILEVIAQKQDSQLERKSVNALMAELAALEDEEV